VVVQRRRPPDNQTTFENRFSSVETPSTHPLLCCRNHLRFFSVHLIVLCDKNLFDSAKFLNSNRRKVSFDFFPIFLILVLKTVTSRCRSHELRLYHKTHEIINKPLISLVKTFLCHATMYLAFSPHQHSITISDKTSIIFYASNRSLSLSSLIHFLFY
jgi:hypothetical protein